MRNLFVFLLLASMVIQYSCLQTIPEQFVYVEGGTFTNMKSNYYGKAIPISGFFICKFEVSQKEWKEVMGNNPSKFKGDNLPVENVSWYDCIEYCNKRSIKEGLSPYYLIDKSKKDQNNTNNFDEVKLIVNIAQKANGYRLPTEAEWEYASSGGLKSKNFSYSGSDNVDDVAWYWKNAGDKYMTGEWFWSEIEKNHCRTHPIGSKKANELGLFDMSGNVREWCYDMHQSVNADDLQGRVWKGGGWIGANFCCSTSFHSSYQANGLAPDQGFRVCRSN